MASQLPTNTSTSPKIVLLSMGPISRYQPILDLGARIMAGKLVCHQFAFEEDLFSLDRLVTYPKYYWGSELVDNLSIQLE